MPFLNAPRVLNPYNLLFTEHAIEGMLNVDKGQASIFTSCFLGNIISTPLSLDFLQQSSKRSYKFEFCEFLFSFSDFNS